MTSAGRADSQFDRIVIDNVQMQIHGVDDARMREILNDLMEKNPEILSVLGQSLSISSFRALPRNFLQQGNIGAVWRALFSAGSAKYQREWSAFLLRV